MKKRNYMLGQLIKQKENYKEIIITVIIIALGVNIFTEGILKFFDIETDSLILIIIGLILSLGVVIFYLYRNIKLINTNVKINGFMIYDRLNNEILDVPRYKISRDICSYLKAAFAEDSELEEKWNKEPLNMIEEGIEEEEERYIESERIIIELLEYCVLEQLSNELDEYFRREDINFENLEKIERDNIPKELLSNRFVNLFTEDFKKRDILKDCQSYSELRFGDELFAIENFETGEIYHKLQLIFSKETRIEKNSKNSLQISTKKYIIDIKVHFNETFALIDKEFEKYYLNIQNYLDENLNYRYPTYPFDVEISVKFKLNTYFSKNKWDYYYWIENFIESLEEYLSMNRFMDEINWKTVRTILQCQDKK